MRTRRIVLWTRNGVSSNWVKDEADEALRLGKLIPLRSGDIDATTVPLGHRGSHLVPLGDFDEVLRTVRSALGGTHKLTPDIAIKKGSQAVAEATTLAWRYSYEYGLHVVICFVLVPMAIDLMSRIPKAVLDNPVPAFNIWVQLGIFFGCLGWSSLFATVLKRRFDSGIFLSIMLLMLVTLLVYLFTPSGKAWEYYADNFLFGIRMFLVVGGLLWLLFFARHLKRLLAG